MFGIKRVSFAGIAAFGIFAISMASAGTARADDLYFDISDWHSFYVSTSSSFGGLDHELDLGGNMGAQLNGETLLGSYCVGLLDPVYNATPYPSSIVTSDGSVYGSAIPNADKISWLLSNYAATAITDDQQNALQAAIWRVENGTNFELDGADNAKAGNSDALITTYQSYLSALGNNTGTVSDVLWISPMDTPTNTFHYQGIAGIRASGTIQEKQRLQSAVPEPSALPLLFGGMGILGGIVRRRRTL